MTARTDACRGVSLAGQRMPGLAVVVGVAGTKPPTVAIALHVTPRELTAFRELEAQLQPRSPAGAILPVAIEHPDFAAHASHVRVLKISEPGNGAAPGLFRVELLCELHQGGAR